MKCESQKRRRSPSSDVRPRCRWLYELETDRDEVLFFEPLPAAKDGYRLSRYRGKDVDAYCYYEANGRLRALTEYNAGIVVDTYFAYDADGRIERVTRGPRGQVPLLISRYGYQNGCIVRAHALGRRALRTTTRGVCPGDRQAR